VAADLHNARSLPKLGAAVRALRQKRGMTQKDLAQAANVSRQWIINIEAGKTPGLEIGRLMRTLDALDSSLHVRDDLPKERKPL